MLIEPVETRVEAVEKITAFGGQVTVIAVVLRAVPNLRIALCRLADERGEGSDLRANRIRLVMIERPPYFL